MMAIKFLLHMHILKRIMLLKGTHFWSLSSATWVQFTISCDLISFRCFNICPESNRPFKWSIPFRFSYHKSMILSPPMCAMCLTHLILHFNILLFCEKLMFHHKKHRKYSYSSETETQTNCLPDEIMKQQSSISKNNWRCNVAVQTLWLVHA